MKIINVAAQCTFHQTMIKLTTTWQYAFYRTQISGQLNIAENPKWQIPSSIQKKKKPVGWYMQGNSEYEGVCYDIL